MFLASSIALIVAILAFVLWVRPSDIELGPPPDPKAHLEERKSAVYANLRDLTFEYRLGKLSDPDYEKTKHGLQEELAKVMAELDSLPGASAPASAAKPAPAQASKSQPTQAKPGPAKAVEAGIDPLVCPHCQARFDKPMKFCGECGKPMPEAKA
jgi:hypothetical protein